MPAPDPKRLRRATVCAAVFDGAGRMLLQRRTDNGQWCLPGGACEVGETVEQTTVREVLEETGREVEVVRLVGLYSDPAYTAITYPDGETVNYVAACFECRLSNPAREADAPPFAPDDETSAVGWFAPDALPEPFLHNHVPRVADAVARRPEAAYR